MNSSQWKGEIRRIYGLPWKLEEFPNELENFTLFLSRKTSPPQTSNPIYTPSSPHLPMYEFMQQFTLPVVVLQNKISKQWTTTINFFFRLKNAKTSL